MRALLAILLLLSATRAAAAWPEMKRYALAMHNSDQTIRDPKLRGAKVSFDSRNAPRKWSGSFSSVFKLTTRSGRAIALRVFHPSEEVTERQDMAAFLRRYTKLHGYLSRLRNKKLLPPEIVDFAIVGDGISVDGRTWPIMKLPFIEGRNLDDWIGTRLSQRRAPALALLANDWREAMKDLRSVGIAHGDLHHGNIVLAPDGALRFIDYDGMWVSDLKAESNSEIGHPNFQHPGYFFPEKSSRPYDRNMDNFGSIVIYLSLIGISDNPTLWKKYHNDYNLIFDGARDFAHPDTSPVFADLKASGNPVVRRLASQLAGYCKGRPGSVPSLERALRQAETPWYQRKAQP
jgi:serine/threonine protein kinase